MKTKIFAVLTLTVICLLFCAPFKTMAAVEPNWPSGKANTCKSPTDGFIDFEKGIDQVMIESSIPGLQFTTTSGINWRYGDIRTGSYNVHSDGSGSYVTNGNFFAWSGVSGNTGRIDFTGGSATYLSLLASTYSGLQLDAYDVNNNLIATSGLASNNTNTGTFTRLTVEAPSGTVMAYVLVHDSGNYWLIDDICTDAAQICKPLPGRTESDHSKKIDLIFVPDDDYGAAADIDTWLPGFLSDVNGQIDNRLGAKTPVTGNLDKFNFYYTTKQGAVSNSNCGQTSSLPKDLMKDCSYADAVVVLHKNEFGDCSAGKIYSAEGPTLRSFIHESGHAVFGVADEYDDAPGCSTSYFQPNQEPNIWNSKTGCENGATSKGWDSTQCNNFTSCQNGWWKIGTQDYIMADGTHFNNGWGDPASSHISWLFGQYQSSPANTGKSISLDFSFINGFIDLIKKYFETQPAPNYLPGEYAFRANVYSTDGTLLGAYGFADPRIVLSESDYNGPTDLNNINFTLTLPYFDNIGHADIVNAGGTVLNSVDLSEYAANHSNPPSDTTPPVITPQINGNMAGSDWYIGDVAVNWLLTDPESGIATSSGCEAVNLTAETAGTTITCTASNGAGLSTSKSITIKIDKTNPGLVWEGGPAAGASYYYDTIPAAPICTATDALSGPADCVISGYSNQAGSYTMIAVARDNAGNKYRETRAYKVLPWTFNGFIGLSTGEAFNIRNNKADVQFSFKIFSGTKEVTDPNAIKSTDYVPIDCFTKKTIGDQTAMDIRPLIPLNHHMGVGYNFYWTPPQESLPIGRFKCYRAIITTADNSTAKIYFKFY